MLGFKKKKTLMKEEYGYFSSQVPHTNDNQLIGFRLSWPFKTFKKMSPFIILCSAVSLCISLNLQ